MDGTHAGAATVWLDGLDLVLILGKPSSIGHVSFIHTMSCHFLLYICHTSLTSVLLLFVYYTVPSDTSTHHHICVP